jgi:hypothetical protein
VNTVMKFVFCCGRGFLVCVTVGLKEILSTLVVFGRSLRSLEDVPILRMTSHCNLTFDPLTTGLGT